MRKITFFFALMLTMVTSAFAQGTLDLSKEYYLKGSYSWGMNSGYLTIGTKSGSNYGAVYMSNEKKQSFTLTAEGTDGGYKISVKQEMGTMSWTEYLNCETTDYLHNNAMTPSVFYFVPTMTAGKYNIKNSRGGFLNAKMINDGTYTANHVFCIGQLGGTDDIIEFELVPAVDEEPETPAAAAPVIQTIVPADGATVEGGVSEIVITFDKEIKSVSSAQVKVKIELEPGKTTTHRAYGSNATIDGCTVTFKFGDGGQFGFTTIEGNGEYSVEIPAALCTSADGGVSEAYSYKFTIAAPVVDVPTALNKTSVTETAYSFEEIAIEFTDEIAFVAASEVESLNVVSNGEVVATVAVEDMEIDEKTLVLCLETPIAPADNTDYTIEIPANFIAKKSNGMVFAGGTFTYKLKVPFDVKSIAPAKEETVDVINNIVVEFSKNVEPSYNTNNLVLVNNADNSTVELKGVTDGKVLTLTPATLVANGTYTLKQKGIANSNGFTALASAKYDAVASVMGNKAEEYLYTITVEHEELEATEYKRNPEIQNNEYDQNKYKLRGVQIFFDEVVKRYNTNGYTGDYGYILDAEGNEVAKLDGCMGGNGTNNKNANPYTTTDITTPGTYKVVVKPGVIFSADGVAEYAGGEFEFTVVKHPVVVAPTAEEGLCYNAEYARVADFQEFEISVKYATEVTIDTDVKVELKKAVIEGFQIVAGETVAEATITLVDGDDIGANEKLIKITFPEMEYAEGSYIFDVPAGLFTVDGVESEAYATNTFKYKKPVLKITRNFDTWSFVYDALDMPNSVMITIENAESVDVDATKVATIAVGDDVYTAANCEYYYNEWSNAWYIQMYFEDFFAADFEFVKGEYTLTLPAGLYTVNGVANEEAVKTFTYGDAVVEEFSVTSILPASGNEFESLDAIAITFSNGFKPEQLIVTCGEKRYRFYSMQGMYVAVDMNYEPIVITEPGTYTLDLSELEGLTGDKVFTWTIVSGETTAIDAVNAEAENAVIYDITGRRVSKVTKAGIYVINGTKVLVK